MKYSKDNEIYAIYDREYMPTSLDIFPDTPDTGKLLEVIGNINYKKEFNKPRSKAALVTRIFNDFLLTLLETVAKGNTVILPGTTGAYIGLQPIPDNEVRRLRQMGKYADYDIIRANFKIPRFVLNFGPKKLRYDTQIYPTKRIQNLALDYAQTGKLTYVEYRKRR